MIYRNPIVSITENYLKFKLALTNDKAVASLQLDYGDYLG